GPGRPRSVVRESRTGNRCRQREFAGPPSSMIVATMPIWARQVPTGVPGIAGHFPARQGRGMPPTIDHPRRLLFYCLPGYGHVFPMLPLAAAARDAGHEVIFATGADAVPVVAGSGFTAHQVGISILDGF